ncbi:DUF2897 family protein [Halomonadaceae bacterium KBTZ08]
MATIEWFILIAVIGSLLGGIVTLKNRAHSLNVSRDQMERIRERKAELEEQEKRENDQEP